MKTMLRFSRFAPLVAAAVIATVAHSAPASSQDIEHVTVNNNSDIALVPTSEGFMNGCVGGSLPPLSQPVEPHTTRVIDVILVKYLSECRFNVLPQPNMTTYAHACLDVKANDTVTFTGSNLQTLQCTIGTV